MCLGRKALLIFQLGAPVPEVRCLSQHDSITLYVDSIDMTVDIHGDPDVYTDLYTYEQRNLIKRQSITGYPT